jgi:hypothetical protein
MTFLFVVQRSFVLLDYIWMQQVLASTLIETCISYVNEVRSYRLFEL